MQNLDERPSCVLTYSAASWSIVWDTDNCVTSLPSPAIESEGKRCFFLGHPLFFNLMCKHAAPLPPALLRYVSRKNRAKEGEAASTSQDRTGRGSSENGDRQDEGCLICQRDWRKEGFTASTTRLSPGQTWSTAAVVVIFQQINAELFVRWLFLSR